MKIVKNALLVIILLVGFIFTAIISFGVLGINLQKISGLFRILADGRIGLFLLVIGMPILAGLAVLLLEFIVNTIKNSKFFDN